MIGHGVPSLTRAPDYVSPDRFTESEVTVDAGGWPLKGTLSIPKGAGPFPGVVLVQGSGPGDRDESFKSTPAEYRQPAHVDAAVINDIAKWVGER